MMNLKMLMRRKIVLVLLSIIPCLFILMVNLTSSTNKTFFQIAIVSSKTLIQAPQVNIALVFVTLATIGFLSSFLSLNLVQQNQSVNRRLVMCGYHPSELILSSLLLMLTMISILVICVSSILLFFFEPKHFYYMMSGMFFTGLTYGSYGILIGSLVKGELEGTLMVVLLANIDAGWLQNPLFFSGARNQMMIQSLPAYFPSQLSIASAFTDLSVTEPLYGSVGYASVFIVLAFIISWYNLRIKPHLQIKLP